MLSHSESGTERVTKGDSGQMARASGRIGIPYVADAAAWDGVNDCLASLWAEVRMRGITRVSATQLSGEIRTLAVAARTAALRPEQFVALVKESWTALPEVRAAADPLRTSDLLSGIITVCIHEFYRD